MKKNYKDMTRKYFYVFDMVLFGLLLFSIEHTMFRENMIIDTMLDVALISSFRFFYIDMRRWQYGRYCYL